MTGRRQATLDNAIAVLGPTSSGIVADVSKLAEMEAMFKAVMAKHGRLDTVVANAITNANGPPGSISEEQFDRTFNTNAKGSCSPFSQLCRCCRAVERSLLLDRRLQSVLRLE